MSQAIEEALFYSFNIIIASTYMNAAQEVVSYILGGGVPLGSWKLYPLLSRPKFASFVTLFQSKNTQLFLILVFCEWSY